MIVEGDELRPFRVAVPDSELADLRDRLDRVRWAPEPRGGDQEYGVSLAFVQRLVAHWRGRYDWRLWERRINLWGSIIGSGLAGLPGWDHR